MIHLVEQELKLFRVGLYDAMTQGAKNITPRWRSIIGSEIASKQAYEELLMMAPFGMLTPSHHGGNIVYDVAPKVGDKQIRPVLWTKGVRYTKQASRLDVTGFIRSLGVLMGRAAAHTENWAAVTALIGGITGTHRNYRGEHVFSTSHDLMAGGTWSNLAPSDLSYTSLAVAIRALRSQTDERRGPLAFDGRLKLVVGPNLEERAGRLVNTDRIPGSADNDNNNYLRTSISQIVVEPFIGQSTAYANGWWLIPENAADNPLKRLRTMPGSQRVVPVETVAGGAIDLIYDIEFADHYFSDRHIYAGYI